jgi:hypothetical protein
MTNVQISPHTNSPSCNQVSQHRYFSSHNALRSSLDLLTQDLNHPRMYTITTMPNNTIKVGTYTTIVSTIRVNMLISG